MYTLGITPKLTSWNTNGTKNLNKQQNSHPAKNRENSYAQPTLAQYMSYNPAFCGGYSLNLAETIVNLDKLAKKDPNVYPKNVREWAGMILEEGNKDKETLISVHKKLYASIKDCFSLDELKAKFPEFSDVKSASEVEFREGTLADDLLKGKIEFFNTEEDLSLQIIKLYWGEGFSLNDLKAYTGGKDLNAIMNKLNIPKVHRQYGYVLKFSDPEYNERLTKQMTLKRQETLDIKAQQQEGEPVHIKRGPLSAEHRQHISEGLIKHYIEHPESIFAISQRQKKYFEDNPDQAELFRKVMTKAWGMPGMEDIKKALSKFMKGKGFILTDDMLESPITATAKKEFSVIKQFYDINEWAKKRLSKNVSYSWKKVKEEQNMYYKMDIIPELFKKRFFLWCEKEGIDTTDMSFDEFKYYPHKPELNTFDTSKLNKYTPKFIDSCPGDESQKLANTYQLALLKFGKSLKEFDNSKTANGETKAKAYLVRQYIKASLFDCENQVFGYPTIKNFDASEIQEIYVEVLRLLMNYHNNKLITKLNKTLNDSYIWLERNWKTGEPMILNPEAYTF